MIGSFGLSWSTGTTGLYTQPPTNIATQDGQDAWMDHLTKNDPMMLHYLEAPYINALYSTNETDPPFAQKLYEDSSILPRIGNLRVPSLHLAGWFDAFTRGQMLTFQKALEQESDGTGRGPNYMVVGPWNHGNTHFITPEARPGLRQMLADWYKHWLAGAPAPAFMSDDRLQYYLIGEGAHLDDTGEWQAAQAWPVPGVQHARYYLRAGGLLSTDPPSADEADASYVYNPPAGTAEIASRWDNALAGAAFYEWDQRLDEPKGLTYTTEPFDSDVKIAGTINLHLRATSVGLPGGPPQVAPGLQQLVPPYHDTDFVVKLSDVDPDTGVATLITEGFLRASHRKLDLGASEFSAAGDVVRAMHPHTAASASPPGAEDTYEIEIWPTAKTFAEGHSLRISIYSADTPNHLTLLKPALNTVHHRAGLESWLLLPLLPA